MKKIIFALLVLVLLVACIPEKPVEPEMKDSDNNQNEASMRASDGDFVREIVVRASKEGFDPDFLAVDLEDRVAILGYTADVPLGITIPEFDFEMEITSTDKSNPDRGEFTATKLGEFAFSCGEQCGEYKDLGGQLKVNPRPVQ